MPRLPAAIIALLVFSVPSRGQNTGAQWTLLGPSFVSAASPTSGRVTALAVDPRNANVIYAGGAEGGIWKTTDGGAHWTPLTDQQPSLATGSIALDPSNPDIVYVGTGEATGYSDGYSGAGVLKSTDGGATWTQLGASVFAGPFNVGDSGYEGGEGGAAIGSIAVNPSNGQILLASAYMLGSPNPAGIYRSTDGGNSWSNVFNSTNVAHPKGVFFDPTNGNIVYASINYDGLYKSTDAGVTWSHSDAAGMNPLPSGQLAVALAPSNTSTLYANLETSTSDYIYQSTDGGVNWTKLAASPEYPSVIAVLPTNPQIVFVGGYALYHSLNGGTTWTGISGTVHPDQQAIAFSSDGTTLFEGSDGGVWSTTNVSSSNVNWTNLNTNLALAQFYPGFSVHPTDASVAFGGTQDTGTLKYSGTSSWTYTNTNCGDGGMTAIDFAVPTTVYSSCAGINLWKSTSSGGPTTWSSAESGINFTDPHAFIPPFVMDPSNHLTLYFGTNRIYQTTNGASNWTVISSTLSTGNAFQVITVAPSDSNTVYASDGNSLQVTTNAGAGTGAVWTGRTGSWIGTITQIAVDPANSQTVYVTFSGYTGFSSDGHVYRTTNGGMSWTDISSNLPNVPANDIVVDPDSSNTLYLATAIGVFITTNGGESWSPFGYGLPRVVVMSLKLQSSTKTLWAATHGRSAWILQLKKRRSQVTSQ